MSISSTAPVIEEEVGGQSRRLLLRNGEIERFEAQHSVGIFELFDQLFGRGSAPQLRHVRDLIALAMVGGGMSDRAADLVMADVGPDQALRLREIAQRVLGVAFIPAVLKETKKKAGMRKAAPAASPIGA
jgi:hypothetical protein